MYVYTLIQNRGILYFIHVLDMTNTVTFLASDLYATPLMPFGFLVSRVI